MNRLRGFFLEFHPIVHTLVLGTILARIAGSMSMPFMALYLILHADMSPELVGITVGLGPLAGTLGGFVGGALSDRFGRKKVMMTAMYVQGLVFFGFALASETWVYMLLSMLNGLSRSFFEPVSQALMSDLTPPEKRYRVFSLRYTAANTGFAIGPILGTILGITAGVAPFLFTGTVFLLYAVVLNVLLNRFGIQHIEEQQQKEHVTIRAALKVLTHDVTLRFFIIGGALGIIGYSQMTVGLSQYVESNFVDGIKLFAWLMSTNAIVVILTQLPISTWAEKRPAIVAILLGNIMYAIGNIGFAFSGSWTMMVLSMVVFTLGEVLTFPAGNVLIDRLAPEGMRGTYYGANSFKDVGRFIGPWTGGILLTSYGGSTMFVVMAAITLFSTSFYSIGLRRSAHLFAPKKGEISA